MKQRRLNPDLVNETIQAPDKTIEDENGLIVLQKLVKENNKDYLYRVIVNVERIPPLVVTLYRTSKLKKYEN
ncbi:MAG: hypothetical protein M0Q90_15810 [Bacteroidales bacterium]|nr:hypothetical protein [Bacteroidales bacterium]